MGKSVIMLLLCLILCNAAVSFADFEDPYYVAGDLAVARPVGLVATIIGGAVFVLCLPFALPAGSVHDTADVLVGDPYRFTFKRPLGYFKTYGSYGLTPESEETNKSKE